MYDLVVELAFGSDPDSNSSTWTWSDVSNWVRWDPGINILAGRSDEAQKAEPTSITFTLDNRDGRFSPDNLSGPYSGHLTRTVPVRVTGEGNIRACAYVASWEVKWDDSGNDCFVEVTASGRLKRIQQQTNLSRSLINRMICSQEDLVEYFPLEDGAATTVAYSALGQGKLNSTNSPQFSAWVPDSGTEWWQMGSDAVVDLSDANISGEINGCPGSEWAIGVCSFFNNDPSTGKTVTALNAYTPGGTVARWSIVYNLSPYDVRLTMIKSNGVDRDSISISPYPSINFVDHIIRAKQNGGNVDVTFQYGDLTVSTSFSGTLAPITAIQLNPEREVIPISPTEDSFCNGFPFGHLRVSSDFDMPRIDSMGSSPRPLYAAMHGEWYDDRINRVCSEEGIPVTIRSPGAANRRFQMSSQGSGTLYDVLEECETADGGLLSDWTEDASLEYIPFDCRYNQTSSMVIQSNRLGTGLTQVVDDSKLVNSSFIKRRNGNTSIFENNESIDMEGLYRQEKTVNLRYDANCLDMAEAEVHVGGFGRSRINQVELRFMAAPELLEDWLTVKVGDRITIAPGPMQMGRDPIDLIVQGWEESITKDDWVVAINTSPARPYDGFRLDDQQFGRLELTQHLTSNISSSSTSIQATTTPGDTLMITTSTFPSMFPFDAMIGGERITVNSISGTSSPQTLTVTRSINGAVSAHWAGDQIRLYKPGQLGR